MQRENTWTPFRGNGEVWGQSQGGAGIPQPTAALPDQDMLPKAWCCPLSKPISSLGWVWPALGLEPKRFFLGGNSTFGRERMKHFKRSACQQRKAVIGIKGRKTFPGSLSPVQRYQKELIHRSSFTHRPSSCNRQKCWDPPQKLSRSPWDSRQCLCSSCSPLLQPLQRGKSNRTLPKSLNQDLCTFFFVFIFIFQSICSWRGSSAAPFHQFKKQRENTQTVLSDGDEPPTPALTPTMTGDLDTLLQKSGLTTNCLLGFGKSLHFPASVFQLQYEHYYLPILVKGFVIFRCTHPHWDSSDTNFCFISDYVIVINLPAFSTGGSNPSQLSRWSSTDFTYSRTGFSPGHFSI